MPWAGKLRGALKTHASSNAEKTVCRTITSKAAGLPLLYVPARSRGSSVWLAIIALCMSVILLSEFAEIHNLPTLMRDWGDDTMEFLRRDTPKLVLVVV